MERACESSVDPGRYRKTLGAYPTGVCVITSISDNIRMGLAVGSFTSISLDPPLVGFFPARASKSWRNIAETGRFCVNILSTRQTEICRRFAASDDDKFRDLSHSVSAAGLPLIDDAIAWIDCHIEAVLDIGDHHLVVGRVHNLGCPDTGEPLVFLRGAYHQPMPLS